LYHSTLGLRVIKTRKEVTRVGDALDIALDELHVGLLVPERLRAEPLVVRCESIQYSVSIVFSEHRIVFSEQKITS